jgi:HD-like signal output (HDOD) protein
MISVMGEDRIITSQNSLELSCPNCKFDLVLELKTDPAKAEHAKPFGGPPDNSDGAAIYSQKRSAIAARKAKILRGLVNLPPMPHIILKAREIIADPDSSLKNLADTIETDQALVAKVLTLANSAYYGVSGMVSSIQHASVLLGQKTLVQLITISASSSLLSKKLKSYQVAPDEMWKHSLACAFGARRLCEKNHPDLVEDAFVAGLLHDAGKIILDPYLERHKDEFARLGRQLDRPFFEAERAIIGFDHAEIMARACRLWRFPEAQSDAIRFHHSPFDSDNGQLAFIIHAADILAKSAGHAAGAPCQITDISKDIQDFLKIDLKDLDTVAKAMLDDVQKIEEEIREG